MKQNQIIAITNGKKSQVEKELSKIHQGLKKSDLLQGLDRTYSPVDEDGIRRPAEKKIIQTTVRRSVVAVSTIMGDLINLVSRMDLGNCEAFADIVIGEITVAKKVPATHLIYLEKRIQDMTDFIVALPTLDAAEKWDWNSNVGCYTAEARETTSTAKIPQHKIVAEATKEHKAQVVEYTLDEIVGYWKTIMLSGNIAADDKAAMVNRVRMLTDAIKIAREEANMVEVPESSIGDEITKYLFGPYLDE